MANCHTLTFTATDWSLAMNTRITCCALAALVIAGMAFAREKPSFDVALTADGATSDTIATLPIDLDAARDILEWDLPADDWSARVVDAHSGEAVPSQTHIRGGEAQVTWLVPGDYADGAKRSYRVTLGVPQPTDGAERLSVERAGGELIVHTPWFAAHHDLSAGGMLGTVEYADDGTLPMRMNDRLYAEDRGQFYLTNDIDPRVRVLSEGPLQVVIRATAQYCRDDATPVKGQPEASYTFRYSAFSPTVQMTATVRQEGSTAWDQVHVFEMHHRTEQPVFDTVAWSPPLESVQFVDEHNIHSLRNARWGALMTDRVALGLIGPDLYGIHTGLSGHGVYVHGPWHTFRGGERQYEATLYLGPSGGSPEALAERIERLSSRWDVSVFIPKLQENIELIRRFMRDKQDLSGGHLGGGPGRRDPNQPPRNIRPVMNWLAEAGEWLLAGAEDASHSLAALRSYEAYLDAASSIVRRMENLLHLPPDGTPNTSPLMHFSETNCVFAGDGIAVCLSRGEDGIRLDQIGRFGDTDASFIAPGAQTGDLWSLVFSAGTEGERRTVRPGSAGETRWDAEGGTLSLRWIGCDLGERSDAVDVTVAVQMSRASNLSRWSIAWENRAEDFGIWEVDFPRISGVGPKGTLCVPRDWGQLHDLPMPGAGYRGRYPSQGAFAQMLTWWRDGAGLYYAAHDPNAGVKQLRALNGTGGTVDFGITTQPAGMGVPAPEGNLAYEVAVGAFDGNWYDAGKIYRTWALGQFWTRRGPIAQRDDMAQWWKDCSLCIRPTGDPDWVTEMGTKLQSAFEMPAVLHWYVWHQIPFDDNYPEYFPVKPGFGDAVQALQDAGVHIMPYVNGHLWDIDTASWKDENGYEAAALRPDGSVYIEGWHGQEHAAMCPASDKWQQKMLDVATRLAGEFGTDGIYLDQIGATRARLCFSEEHGHPVGGGGFWALGYDELLAQMRARCREINPRFIITTESHAEPYMAGLDGHLMCNIVGANQVPLYAAIYGGYTQTFGRLGEVENPVAFRMEHGQAFVFGSMMGRINSLLLLKPENAELLAYLKSLAEIRRDYRDFLAFGEMLRPPAVEGEVPDVTTQWLSKTEDIVTMPAIQAGAWRAQDGRLGFFYTNVADEPVAFEHTFSLKEYAVPTTPGLKVRLKTFNAPDGAEPELEAGDTGKFTASHMMQSMETMALVVE